MLLVQIDADLAQFKEAQLLDSLSTFIYFKLPPFESWAVKLREFTAAIIFFVLENNYTH